MSTDNQGSAVRDAVVSFIRDELSYGQDEALGDEVDLIATGVLDSLNLLRLVSFLEKKFKLTVDDEDLAPQNFKSLKAISEYVANQKSS